MSGGFEPFPRDMDPLVSTRLAFEHAIMQLSLSYITARHQTARAEISLVGYDSVQAIVCTSIYQKSGHTEITGSEDIYLFVMKDGEAYTVRSANDGFEDTTPGNQESIEERQLAKRYFREAIASGSGDTVDWLSKVYESLEETNPFRGLAINILFGDCPDYKEQKQERWGSFLFKNGTTVTTLMRVPYDHQLAETNVLQADEFDIVIKENTGRRYVYSKNIDSSEHLLITGIDERAAPPKRTSGLDILEYFGFLNELERIKDGAMEATQLDVNKLTEGKVSQMLGVLQAALNSESDSGYPN